MKIFAIDPGNRESGYVLADSSLKPIMFGKIDNAELLVVIANLPGNDKYKFVIEGIASYGMPVGAEVFETAEYIGYVSRFIEENHYVKPVKIFRKDEKITICHSMKATDATIKQALVDRFAAGMSNYGKGTKKNPGWFYGFKADVWSAYAIAVTYHDMYLR